MSNELEGDGAMVVIELWMRFRGTGAGGDQVGYYCETETESPSSTLPHVELMFQVTQRSLRQRAESRTGLTVAHPHGTRTAPGLGSGGVLHCILVPPVRVRGLCCARAATMAWALTPGPNMEVTNKVRSGQVYYSAKV
jgi:hypothetical protein